MGLETDTCRRNEGIIRKTEAGLIRGTADGELIRFLGVPYAKPPVGSLRFQDAKAFEGMGWEICLDGTRFGPSAPQLPSRLSRVIGERAILWDEDCLNLNVIAPQDCSEKKPVVVWIHGGAYVSGCNSLDWYDGSKFAEDGIVFVGLNYRLGALGFLKCGEWSSGRMGLTDVLEALRFLQRNIGVFGGDPNRITVMGQSAGAQVILCLLAMEEADGLFSQAILQSPPLESAPYAEGEAEEVWLEIAELLGTKQEECGDWMGQVSAEDLLTIPERYTQKYLSKRGLMLFKPTLEQCSNTQRLIEQAAQGARRNEIRVILGAAANEMNAFFGPEGVMRSCTEDTEFWKPAVRLAEAFRDHEVPVWFYQFDWYPKESELFACHCIDVPFVFENLDCWADAPMLKGAGRKGSQDLSRAMHKAWSSFVQGKEPLTEAFWPQFDLEGSIIWFGKNSRRTDVGQVERRAAAKDQERSLAAGNAGKAAVRELENAGPDGFWHRKKRQGIGGRARWIRVVLAIGVLLFCAGFAGRMIWYEANPQAHPGGAVASAYSGELTQEWSGVYEIGTNAFQVPVFREPKEAFSQIQKDCAEGFEAIRQEFHLSEVSPWNWKMYGIYGDQLMVDDERLRAQGRRISGFFDIYENSFMVRTEDTSESGTAADNLPA